MARKPRGSKRRRQTRPATAKLRHPRGFLLFPSRPVRWELEASGSFKRKRLLVSIVAPKPANFSRLGLKKHPPDPHLEFEIPEPAEWSLDDLVKWMRALLAVVKRRKGVKAFALRADVRYPDEQTPEGGLHFDVDRGFDYGSIRQTPFQYLTAAQARADIRDWFESWVTFRDPKTGELTTSFRKKDHGYSVGLSYINRLVIAVEKVQGRQWRPRHGKVKRIRAQRYSN